MSKFLCKVVDAFKFTDGRLVIVTDVPFEDFDAAYNMSATIELRCPDGRFITTESSFIYVTPTNFGKPVSLSLGNTLDKSDVPIGTEVWLLEE
ncbi:MAG: hypothetical protein K2Z81_23160 [Cyanobacteria bacterium]|nr:hypothetical protein [Cyanobacteriota bacterium]